MKKIALLLIITFFSTLANARDFSDVPHVAYGDARAKILIDEYASLSCGHCKAFYENVFSQLKTNYIDTGKIYFRFFHFPLDRNSLQASKLVQCFDGEKAKKLLETLFKTQGEWSHENEVNAIGKLRNVALVSGISKENFEACISNAAMEDALLKHQLEVSQKLNINSTPTIIINGKVYNGAKEYDQITTEILKLK